MNLFSILFNKKGWSFVEEKEFESDAKIPL